MYGTVAALRRILGIADGFDDAELIDCLSTASAAVDAHCGRMFDVPAAASARTFRASLSEPGVVVVDDIADTTGLVISDAGSAVALGNVTVQPVNGVGVDGRAGWPIVALSLRSGYWSTGASRYEFPITVTARWGWLATPSPVTRAALLLGKDQWHTRDARFGAASVGDLVYRVRANGTVTELLAPYVRYDRVVGLV